MYFTFGGVAPLMVYRLSPLGNKQHRHRKQQQNSEWQSYGAGAHVPRSNRGWLKCFCFLQRNIK